MSIATLTAAVLAALVMGFAGGWKTEAWHNAANELARTRIEGRDQVKRMDRIDDAAARHESFKKTEEIRYVTRTKIVDRIVDRPVYRSACFDDDGLQLVNAAIAGTDSAGQPASAVPGPATAGR